MTRFGRQNQVIPQEEIDRLRQHVEAVEVWVAAQAAERAHRLAPFAKKLDEIKARLHTPDRVLPSGALVGDHSTARDHRMSYRIHSWAQRRMRPWYEANPRPDPFDTPAAILEGFPLTEALLNHNSAMGPPAVASDPTSWAREYRKALGRVRAFGSLAPSVTRDPLLQRCDDPRAGLADVLEWCRALVAEIDRRNAVHENSAAASRSPSTWLAEAMLKVRDHPDWSDRKIAQSIGRSPSTLSRNEGYQQAALISRQSVARAPVQGFHRRGDDGWVDVEAVDPAD